MINPSFVRDNFQAINVNRKESCDPLTAVRGSSFRNCILFASYFIERSKVGVINRFIRAGVRERRGWGGLPLSGEFIIVSESRMRLKEPADLSRSPRSQEGPFIALRSKLPLILRVTI